MKAKKTILMAMAALMLPLLAFGQNNAAQAQQGKEVRLHKVVYYKIRESDNVEYAATTALREVAEFMAKYPDATISLVGYADRGTGNPTLNVMYALNRASKFKNDLVQRYGVDPKRIVADSRGDVEQPFRENDKNRCVIVEGVGHESSSIVQINPVMPPNANAYATNARQQYQDDRDRRYDAAMGRTDTIYVQQTDTIFVLSPVDSLKEETPFGLNKRNRWRNWFVQLGVGPGIYQGDHNHDAEWGDRLYPQGSFSLGKWIVPAVGVRVGVDLDMVHMYKPNWLVTNGENYHHVDGIYDKDPRMTKLKFNAWNFRADVMVNLSAFMWAPYQKRFINIIPYAGLGRIAVWDDAFKYSISLNAGLLAQVRLNEHLDFNLEARVKKFADDLNWYEQGHKRDGIADLSLGLTWNFTKRGF